MQRLVEPELLDELPVDDPTAIASRRDLRRVNWWMGNPRILAAALVKIHHAEAPSAIVDLGAGDGDFLRRLAPALPRSWRNARMILVDANARPAKDALDALSSFGWEHECVATDVTSFVAERGDSGHITIANLFLHHLDPAALRRLFGLLEEKSMGIVACEPRRSRLALMASRALGVIGCNAVTRYDAQCSVRAGFRGRELSDLWPDRPGWDLFEGERGMFSHVFCAGRNGLSGAGRGSSS